MILVRRKPIVAGVSLAVLLLCSVLLVHAWTDTARDIITLSDTPTVHVADLSGGQIALAIKNRGLVIIHLADEAIVRVDPHTIGSTLRQAEPVLAADVLHKHVLISSRMPNRIVAIDARGAYAFSVPVDGWVDAIVASPATGWLYAAVREPSGSADDLVTFDGVSGVRVRSAHLGAQVGALALDDRTGHIFAIDDSSGVVTTIDDRTGKVLYHTSALVPFGLAPAGVVVDTATARLFIRDTDSDRNISHVRVFDTRSGHLLTTVALKGSPCLNHGCQTNLPLLLDRATGSIIVANDDGSVSQLDGHTGRVDHTDVLRTGHPSYSIISMIMNENTGQIYVSLDGHQHAEGSALDSGTLCRIDDRADFLHYSCSAGVAQTLFAVDAQGKRALVLRTYAVPPRYNLLGWLQAGARRLLGLSIAESATQSGTKRSTIMIADIGP